MTASTRWSRAGAVARRRRAPRPPRRRPCRPGPRGTSWGSRAMRRPCWRMTSPSSGSISPSDQPQQRALALAVATQQADPLAPLDLPVDLIQQPRTAEGQADVSQAQQCHGMISISCCRSETAGDPAHGTTPARRTSGAGDLQPNKFGGAAARRPGPRRPARSAARPVAGGDAHVSFPTGRRVACRPPSWLTVRAGRGTDAGVGVRSGDPGDVPHPAGWSHTDRPSASPAAFLPPTDRRGVPCPNRVLPPPRRRARPRSPSRPCATAISLVILVAVCIVGFFQYSAVLGYNAAVKALERARWKSRTRTS